MTINNILIIHPFTRINDHFLNNDSHINASPIGKNIYHPLVTGFPNSQRIHFKEEFYKYIGCDIVSETVLNYPHPFMTEKTIRPIMCKRMFIILGAPHTLQLLHSKGFQTFDDFVDETYDTILNPEERFLAVVEETKKLCEKPTKKIIEYLKSIEERLNHNFYTLKNLENIEIQELKKRLNIND